MTAASVDSTYQSPKGPIPSSGPSQSLQAEAWDWLRSAWVPFLYNASGISQLPATAVNASSGEVRVKVTSAGAQVFFGQLTLTGTVH